MRQMNINTSTNLSLKVDANISINVYASSILSLNDSPAAVATHAIGSRTLRKTGGSFCDVHFSLQRLCAAGWFLTKFTKLFSKMRIVSMLPFWGRLMRELGEERERERDAQHHHGTKRGREKERETVKMCMCVLIRQYHWLSHSFCLSPTLSWRCTHAFFASLTHTSPVLTLPSPIFLLLIHTHTHKHTHTYIRTSQEAH